MDRNRSSRATARLATTVAVLAALVSTQPACSFMFAKEPRMVAADASPDELGCSPQNAAPVFDSILAVAMTGLAMWPLALLADKAATQDRPRWRVSFALGLTFGAGAFFGTSAAWGYSTVNQCRILTDALRPATPLRPPMLLRRPPPSVSPAP